MKSKLTWLEVFLLAAPFLALAFYWKELPARVPVHWNLHNQVDGWGSKASGLLTPPLLSLGIVALLHILPRFDPKLQKRAGENSRMPTVLAVLRVSLAAFIDIIFCAQLFVALNHDVPVGRVVDSACLFLFAVLGNYSGTFRPNYFVGLRTPWTLESPETWRATHRLGGRLMFFGALVLFVLQFFIDETLFIILLLSALLALLVWTFWYSWHYFHALQSATQ